MIAHALHLTSLGLAPAEFRSRLQEMRLQESGQTLHEIEGVCSETPKHEGRGLIICLS